MFKKKEEKTERRERKKKLPGRACPFLSFPQIFYFQRRICEKVHPALTLKGRSLFHMICRQKLERNWKRIMKKKKKN
jgi:hypothetical protein